MTNITEDGEQEAIIEYCKLQGIPIIHIPNEGKRSPAYAAKMKRMGLARGAPDLLIPTAKRGFYGLFIELKRDKKAKVSDEQIEWLQRLNAEGYYARVCYGADEAIQLIKEYVNGKSTKSTY